MIKKQENSTQSTPTMEDKTSSLPSSQLLTPEEKKRKRKQEIKANKENSITFFGEMAIWGVAFGLLYDETHLVLAIVLPLVNVMILGLIFYHLSFRWWVVFATLSLIGWVSAFLVISL